MDLTRFSSVSRNLQLGEPLSLWARCRRPNNFHPQIMRNSNILVYFEYCNFVSHNTWHELLLVVWICCLLTYNSLRDRRGKKGERHRLRYLIKPRWILDLGNDQACAHKTTTTTGRKTDRLRSRRFHVANFLSERFKWEAAVSDISCLWPKFQSR